ncbi:MAG TPA: hypothetical protein VLA61_10235 [Ideonella sp.]|uniref:hypothetical protein n=1 Tax=Ideonella sp. TaxID=1929293 RepID=UPI002D1BDDA9|nr:hypothetical protein [Ideonella sp.]HSI48638.1 hypothetical protein [Ideonella sp.]
MNHAWQFFRAGGVDQVLIASGEDIAHLRELDQKLWVALACPTRGTHFDARTLDLIDTDHDGRIRAPELLAACEWACERLADPEQLVRGGERLALASLADNEEGRALAEEARRTLARLDSAEAKAGDIGLEAIAERQQHLADERLNGDGIVTAANAGDDTALRGLIEQVIEIQGSVKDAGGEAGIGVDQATAFFDAAEALLAWHHQGESDCGDMRSAAQAVDAVHDKVEDFFARCRLASYAAGAAEALNLPAPETLQGYALQSLSLSADPLRQLPLAPVSAGRPLPLDHGANPAWQTALQDLRQLAVAPLLGSERNTLAEAEWQDLKSRVTHCRDWLATRPPGKVAALGADKLLALLGQDLAASRARLLALIEEDEAAAPQHGHVNDLEKLLRLQRDLLPLLRNFVSFEAFYRREGAIFQAGRLYLDGRSCDLVVQVNDAGQHAVIAGLAKAYLAYCECVRGSEKMTIVAAFTAGDVDFLFVGRNGVFYDREGRDWDARIVKVIENPIGIRQAFLLPYKKFLRLIEEQVAKRAAASDATQQGKLGGLAGQVATLDKATPPAPAAPAASAAALNARRIDVGTVAALGVALGSISAVIVGVFGKFVELGWWIPVALIGIVLSISGPSMLIAWLKLRQRSLGPILDASGWAINGRMRLNVRLGASLSEEAKLPPGASRKPDPYAERHGTAWTVSALVLVVVLLALGWRMGWLNGVLPEALRHGAAVAAVTK